MGFGPKNPSAGEAVIVGGGPSSITYSNVAKFHPIAGTVTDTGDAVGVRSSVPVAGTFTRLAVHLAVAVTSGHTLTVTLMVNGVASALAVTIDNADGTDVVIATDAIAVNAGDVVNLQFIKDTAGAQNFQPNWALTFQA